MIDLIRKITLACQSNRSIKLSPLLTVNSNFICYVINSCEIEILDYNRKDRAANISLKEGHSEQITCLKFNDIDSSRHLLLCSCSIDHILIWDVNELFRSGNGQARILKANLEFEPNQCMFHPEKKIVAVCYADYLIAIDIEVSEYKQTYCGNSEFASNPN